MAATGVVGRNAELESIRDFVTGAGGETRALTLYGEAGIGKTILWEAGIEQATALGHHVLQHRAVEAEAGFAFTGLADLVTESLPKVASSLAAPRRHALEVALLLREPGDDPPDSRAIGLALLDLLRLLAASGPVLIAIDDLQWLDSSSRVVLPLALRRLRDEPVSVLTTLRSAPGTSAPFELERIVGRDAAREHALSGLTLGDLHRLLTDRRGIELPRPALARILETSRGNPLFAIELASGHPVGAPDSLRDALRARLATLPANTLEVLATVAALAQPTPELAAAGLDQPGTGLDALDLAVQERVVQLEGSRVRFTHPLLATLCYEHVPPRRRRAMHARLADAVTDVEQRARHRALATEGANADVASVLDAAAEHAAARGATAAAAELTELAVERTATEDEAERHRRRFAAAGLHHLSGDFARATSLYEDLEREVPAGPERADALYGHATVGREDLPTRVRLCEQALIEAADDDARCAELLGLIALFRWVLGDLRAGLRDARAGLVRAERGGDPRVLTVALGRVGILETWALDITPGLLERGVALERNLPRPAWFNDSPAFMLTQRLYETDQLARSRSMLEEMERSALERGDEHTRQWVVLQLLIVEWYAGRWAKALEHAGIAREIAEQTQEAQYGGMVASVTSRVEAGLGLLSQAQRTAEEGLRLSQSVSDEIFSVANLASLGHVQLTLGDLNAAANCLRDLPERQLRTGHLSSLVGSWADTIEVLVGLGELPQAGAYLARYEPISVRANRWARVGAARSAGLLAAAQGDTDAATAALERALAADDEPAMYPFERARTLLALGSVRRQALQRRAARTAFDRAAAMFEELGAHAWTEKVHDQLSRISGRRGTRDELTEAERRVASLAADGLRNREIGAALYISVATVEAHLSRVYRKLGLRSRTELAGRFPRGGR